MNEIKSTFPSIRRTILYAEWTLLLVTTFICLTSSAIYYLPNTPKIVILPFIFAFALLSLIFPIKHNINQRRAYIFLEILLLLSIRLIGFNLDTILVHIIIAKSCFLLGRKDVIITVIATGLAWSLISFSTFPRAIEWLSSVNPPTAEDTKQIIIDSLIQDVGYYLAASVFVILMSFVVLAEQKSRQQAVTLAQEVEVLAATLERTRIAREVHDTLGHTLTTLDVQLELVQRLRQRKPEQAVQALDTAKILAKQCLQDVRIAVQTMRSKDFNLNEALSTLVEQVKQNQSFTIRVDVSLPKLPLQTSHQLYCIVQEGLTNIQKHAHACCVTLRGYSTVSAIILELTDDGRGFDSELPRSGFGLRGMQERVQLLGGELKINTQINKGTAIQVMVPLHEA
ncbi:sensor histidine kinase [Komarekiella sp. 'clone 1']|uniref:histidine kinase n=1 Tax=Komarekiella delphini-convector SJRDD-AB1 TaxID=2593771 RepID=A0AA40SV87_9NOST|nr:sensor histidine kinase [Komarekiella delphini-convector]MBD6615684.1 sensor histidine kinase [Komarekiella delphini-convector SJRDD-AB1]